MLSFRYTKQTRKNVADTKIKEEDVIPACLLNMICGFFERRDLSRWWTYHDNIGWLDEIRKLNDNFSKLEADVNIAKNITNFCHSE